MDLTDDDIWSDLRSGTIITVAEDVPTDVSYDPAAGDWWINVQANDDADGLYIEASNFPVSSSDWQLRLRNPDDVIVYGPAGEGISPAGGVSGTEIFRWKPIRPMKLRPTRTTTTMEPTSVPSVLPISGVGRRLTTCVRSNRPTRRFPWLLPMAERFSSSAKTVTVEWISDGAVESVLVEFSFDQGETWQGVFPANRGNAGQYTWTVPPVDSDQCLIRVSSATRPAVYDTSDASFTVLPMD